VSRKRLEALLLTACKALGYGAVNVDPERARAWGVPVGQLVQKGAPIPGSRTKARTAGYYCPRSSPLGAPAFCLMVDVGSNGDRAFYSVAVLSEDNTGHRHLGTLEAFSKAGLEAYLRGVADGAGARS